MAIQKTEKIWHNGKLIAWDDARIHVMSHVIHYGSSVFEGVRCYALPAGPAIFRAHEHAQRLLDSAKVYRIDVDYTRDDIVKAMRVVTDLKIKGVHGEVIETAVCAAFDEVNEEKQARAFLHRKRLRKPQDQKQAARIFRQLTRAGFRSKTIFTILKKWDVDEETLTALEGETAE